MKQVWFWQENKKDQASTYVKREDKELLFLVTECLGNYGMRWTRSSYSLLPNVLAIMGRTSSTAAKVSKNGINDISSLSDGSSNQLFTGIQIRYLQVKIQIRYLQN